VPRARLNGPGGKTTEWNSQVLRAYQRRTLAADALIASTYPSGGQNCTPNDTPPSRPAGITSGRRYRQFFLHSESGRNSASSKTCLWALLIHDRKGLVDICFRRQPRPIQLPPA
jgi:hypothetical protein